MTRLRLTSFCSHSAGIGRTGVLITMETALCLMECGQPVYPLDIVRTMRDQRAMMIQTPVSTPSVCAAALALALRFSAASLSPQSQYRFVCEAILKVYEEGLVQPSRAAVYAHRDRSSEEVEEKEAQRDEGEEVVVAAAELLDGGLDEEEDDDDDEEVEVLDVGEVTEEEDEEVEEPSVASATSVTSETGANPDPENP